MIWQNKILIILFCKEKSCTFIILTWYIYKIQFIWILLITTCRNSKFFKLNWVVLILKNKSELIKAYLIIYAHEICLKGIKLGTKW